jgi:hypothetical protein
MDRFPDNPVARNGLAEVLKSAGRLEEAAHLGSQTNGPIDSGVTDNFRVDTNQHRSGDSAQDSDDRHPTPTASTEAGAGYGNLMEASAEEGPTEPKFEPVSGSGRGVMEETLALRAAAVGVRSLPKPSRDKPAREVLRSVERSLSRNQNDVDALFTKIETLSLLGEVVPATAELDALPDYLAERPEFLALRGSLALEAIQSEDVPVYAEEKLASVTAPWREAARRQRALEAVPYVASLRASLAMVDGQALDARRRESTQQLGEVLSTAHNDDNLFAWYSTSVSSILKGVAELPGDQLADLVKERADSLDELDRELVGASRYSYAPR